jgi:hypothetical protein
MVPKEFAMSDIYCQLIPNDDDKNPYYEVVPRIGSFEVSFNGVVSTNIFLGYNHIFNSCSFLNAYPVCGQITQQFLSDATRLLRQQIKVKKYQCFRLLALVNREPLKKASPWDKQE